MNYIDKPTKFDAIRSLRPNARFSLRNGEIEIWQTDDSIPTEEEINAKIQELQAAEPLRLLRIERDTRLSKTDWRATVDYPGTDQEAWLTYRQALRDLPSTQTPSLDENGNLINVTWPEEPV